MSKTLPVSSRPIPRDDNGRPVPPWQRMGEMLNGRSQYTAATYLTSLRLLADWLQKNKKCGYTLKTRWPLDPSPLNNDALVKFDKWMNRRYAKKTVRTYRAGILAYLDELDVQDALPSGIDISRLRRQWKARSRYTRNEAGEQVLSQDETRQDAIPAILDYYRRLPLPPLDKNGRNRRVRLSLLRDKAFVEVLYATAARVSEVVSIEVNQVSNGQTALFITGKGDKSRIIYLRNCPKAHEAIQAYLKGREASGAKAVKSRWLFTSHALNSDGSPLSPQAARQIIKRAVKVLGLAESISPHDFRHYRATQLLRAGMSLEVVQEFLGHGDIGTTRGVYAPVLGRDAVERQLDEYDIQRA